MISKVVVISPKVKKIYLQRFLLSKLVYDKENFDFRDLATLFENQLWLEKKVLEDEGFRTKFGKSLEDLSIILKQINFQQEFSIRALNRLSTRVKHVLEKFILPNRNLLQAKSKVGGSYQLKDSQPLGIQRRKLREPSRIGIGYRDKGSAKNLAKDGSPSWQEVAMHRGPLYKNGRKITNETNTGNEENETIAGKLLEKLQSFG